MSRLFVLCSLTALLCVVTHHCAAQNIRTPCASIESCHPMNSSNHAKRNYLLGEMLNDQVKKDSSVQNGAQQDASNGQPNGGNVDDVEAAIQSAKEKVSSAEKALNGVLTSARATQSAANAAEAKQVKEIEAAKTEVDNVKSSDADDISEFVTTITEAEKKAKEKIQKAKEKANSAVTKANDANTKLQKATSELKEEETITDSDEKKKKASTSGRHAESVETEAQSAQTDISESKTALEEVKQNHKNAQVALYKVKAIVSAGRLSTMCESVQSEEERIEAVRTEVETTVSKMSDILNTFLDPLKEKGRQQLTISKNIYESIQKEVKSVKNAFYSVKTQKFMTTRVVQSIKVKTTVETAKEVYEKVEGYLSRAATEEQKAKTALNNAKTELEKVKKTEKIFDAILNADNVYNAIILSKEYEDEAKQKEKSASLNISEIEAMKMDDMRDESKQKIAKQLDVSKKMLENIKAGIKSITKAVNDAEKYKAEAEKIVAEAEKAADTAAAETAKINADKIGLSALSEVVIAKNIFNKVAAEAHSIEKLKYTAKIVALTHGITKLNKLKKGYVEEATKSEKAAEASVKAIEILPMNQLKDVRQKVTQQLNAANQVLQHLKSEATKFNSAKTNVERQIESANTAVTTTQQAVSAADAKREAQKVITAASTAEKELAKAKVALDCVKIDAAKIERAKHMANVIIDANKMDQLYDEIKREYDGVIEKKRDLDAIVTTVQQIFNECPKEAHDEMKSYLQTSQAALAATQIELNNAQKAEEKTKQLNKEALTALKNVMKAETSLTEIQTMTAKISDAISVAQEKIQMAQNAMIKAKMEFDKAEKAKYVASVFLSSVKTGKAVTNANRYKKSVTDKKEEAKSAIKVIEGLHQGVSIGFSFMIANRLNIAEELFETLSQEEINAANTVNKAKDANDEVDGFLTEVKNPNISVNDAKSIAEKAEASKIRAANEEGKAKDALTSVTSDLEKIIKAKQDAENVNNDSQQTSGKPLSSVISKKKPLQKETSAKSSVNERENETQGKKVKNTEVKIPEFQVMNNTKNTLKRETKENEEDNKKNNYNILFSDENNINTGNIDKTQHNVNKTVEKTFDGAVNTFYTIFVSLNILFWALMFFE